MTRVSNKERLLAKESYNMTEPIQKETKHDNGGGKQCVRACMQITKQNLQSHHSYQMQPRMSFCKQSYRHCGINKVYQPIRILQSNKGVTSKTLLLLGPVTINLLPKDRINKTANYSLSTNRSNCSYTIKKFKGFTQQSVPLPSIVYQH